MIYFLAGAVLGLLFCVVWNARVIHSMQEEHRTVLERLKKTGDLADEACNRLCPLEAWRKEFERMLCNSGSIHYHRDTSYGVFGFSEIEVIQQSAMIGSSVITLQALAEYVLLDKEIKCIEQVEKVYAKPDK